MTWRVIRPVRDTLASAPEHSYHDRASVIISHHLSPYSTRWYLRRASAL